MPRSIRKSLESQPLSGLVLDQPSQHYQHCRQPQNLPSSEILSCRSACVPETRSSAPSWVTWRSACKNVQELTARRPGHGCVGALIVSCISGCILLRIKSCMHPVNYILHVS